MAYFPPNLTADVVISSGEYIVPDIQDQVYIYLPPDESVDFHSDGSPYRYPILSSSDISFPEFGTEIKDVDSQDGSFVDGELSTEILFYSTFNDGSVVDVGVEGLIIDQFGNIDFNSDVCSENIIPVHIEFDQGYLSGYTPPSIDVINFCWQKCSSYNIPEFTKILDYYVFDNPIILCPGIGNLSKPIIITDVECSNGSSVNGDLQTSRNLIGYFYDGSDSDVSLQTIQSLEADAYGGSDSTTDDLIYGHPFNIIDYISFTGPAGDFFDHENGVIVTVGTPTGEYSECLGDFTNYSTIQSAYNAVPSGSAIFIYPGTYDENISVQKDLVVVGLGANPSETTIWSKTAPYGTNFSFSIYNNRFYCENLRVRSDSDWESTIQAYHPGAEIVVNRCYIHASNKTTNLKTRGSAEYAIFDVPSKFINCYITKGYDHFNYWVKESIWLEKTQFDQSISFFGGSGTTWANDDYVITPTDGYGYNYGEFYVDICRHINFVDGSNVDSTLSTLHGFYDLDISDGSSIDCDIEIHPSEDLLGDFSVYPLGADCAEILAAKNGGTVVTVYSPVPEKWQSFPNYSSLSSAIAAVSNGSVIVVMPGSHSEGYTAVNKVVHIIGGGENPEDVIITPTVTQTFLDIQADGTIIENLTLNAYTNGEARSIWYGYSASDMNSGTIRRVRFTRSDPSSPYAFIYFGPRYLPSDTSKHLTIEYCYIEGTAFRWTDLSLVSIHKCYIPDYDTFQSHNSLAVADYVTTPTEGYGPEYIEPPYYSDCGQFYFSGGSSVEGVIITEDTFYGDLDNGSSVDFDLTIFVPALLDATVSEGSSVDPVLLQIFTSLNGDIDDGSSLDVDLVVPKPELLQPRAYTGMSMSGEGVSRAPSLPCNAYSGCNLETDLTIFPSIILEPRSYTGETGSVFDFKITQNFQPKAYTGESGSSDIDYIVNEGIPMVAYSGDVGTLDALSTSTTFEIFCASGEYAESSINPTIAIRDIDAITGEILSVTVTTNLPDEFEPRGFTGQVVPNFNLSTTSIIRLYDNLTGQNAYTSLTTSASAGIGNIIAYTGERGTVDTIRISIALGTSYARTGERSTVDTIQFESNYRFYTGETHKTELSTEVSLDVFSYTGEIARFDLDIHPSGPIGVLRSYTGENVYAPIEALISKFFDVCFSNNIGMAFSFEPLPKYDLTTDCSCDGRLSYDKSPCDFDIELNHGPTQDMHMDDSHSLLMNVDLQTNPRFELLFYSGENTDLSKYEKFLEPIEFTLSAYTGESAQLISFYPNNRHRVCRGNFIPEGDSILVELTDVLSDDCESYGAFTGQFMDVEISVQQNTSHRMTTGEYAKASLSISTAWLLRAYTGERMTMPSEAIFAPRAYTGQRMTVEFEVLPIMGYTGQEMTIEISDDVAVHFKESGCLPNEFQFLNNDGAKVLDDITWAIELHPYQHDIKVGCGRSSQEQ